MKGKLWTILSLKCPRCQEGKLFNNPNPYNINDIDKMPSHCPNCNLDYEPELGFWYGAMFVSYAVTAVFLIIVLGFSLIVQGSISRTYLWICIAFMLLTWPYIFRVSRSIWLNISQFVDKHIQ
ncbi:MAG: DUF983 domain-containing protein [Chitinophagales bacterium]